MHNIDMTNGRANMAFLGSRQDIWHRLGEEMQPGMSIDAWATAAGLNWTAIKVPAIASLEGAQFDHIEAGHRFRPVDDRFQMDVAGSLKSGETIWATATYRDPLEIAGERHTARVLMTTTFDGTGSTINQGTMTRTVCNNTLNVALADKRAVVRTRHNTKFDAGRVGKELAQIAKGFANYKAMGDALAQNEMAKEEVSAFFKECLDIPFDAKAADISGRKRNQFDAVSKAYRISVREGAPAGSAWAALNAITRYVDHDRTNGTDEAVFSTAQFGSGAAIKAQAVELLMPRIADKVLIPA